MLYLSNDAITSAIQELHKAGTHEYFRTYLALKAHGLTLGSTEYIRVTTTNTATPFQLLYGVPDLLDGEPFYNPLRNESMKEDTMRGTVQTHIKKFADGATKTKMTWLEAEQRGPEGQNNENPWYIRFSPEYPSSLGSGQAGLAERDDCQVTIHRPSFVIWFHRFGCWETQPSFSELWDIVCERLNLTELEIDLLFTKEMSFENDPFVDQEPDRNALTQWIRNELKRGSTQKVLVSPSRKSFSPAKMQRLVSGYRQTGPESTWWDSAQPETEARDILEQTRALMLIGAPGTGKTRLAFSLANSITSGDSDRIHTFQFHSSFAYEDFIESLQPKSSGVLEFQPIKKRFAIACQAALDAPQVVILDEFNRADVSKVFGEAFMLIERSYRDSKYAIPFLHNTSDRFWIPPDLYVVATLNNLDKSTFDLDFALRRRFGQVEVRPSADKLMEILEAAGCQDQDFRRILRSAFVQIQQSYPLGHAYFLGVKDRPTLAAAYRRVIRPTIEAYLGQYRQEQYNRVDSILKRVCVVSSWEQYLDIEE